MKRRYEPRCRKTNPTLEHVFLVQRMRVAANLRHRGDRYRARLTKLGEGQLAVEVRGTSGGGPSPRFMDERDATSERDLYGAW